MVIIHQNKLEETKFVRICPSVWYQMAISGFLAHGLFVENSGFVYFSFANEVIEFNAHRIGHFYAIYLGGIVILVKVTINFTKAFFN